MESRSVFASSRRAWDRRDAVVVVVLVLVCWLTRLPSLDRVALNPDESQYEATAAYLLAEDLSAFSIPHTSPGTFSFYKGVAWLFGPYSTFEVRLFVLLLVAFVAVLVGRMVAERGSPWCGLAAGLVVPLWSLYFEGLTANREWFCNALLVAGAFLFLRGAERRDVRGDLALIASGVLCGAALGFKLHAGLLVLPPVALCLWWAWVGVARGTALRALGLYALGGVLITLAGMVPFALVGSLGSFLRSIVVDLFGYAAAADPAAARQETLAGRFYLGLPGRPLLLVAYGFAGLVTWATLFRPRREPAVASRPLRSPTAQLFVAFLVLSVVTISLGGRFFGHYYLFLVPPVALLLGLAWHWLVVDAAATRLATGSAAAFVVLLLLDRAFGWPERIDAGTWLYLALLASLLLFGASRSALRRSRAIAAILALEVVFVGLHARGLATPRSAPYPGHDFAAVTEEISRRSRPDDRLFVWGWAPELYSLTRLTPASQFVISMYLVDDTRPDPRTSAIDPGYERQLMQELSAVAPRFIVDASARSWTMVATGDPWLYELDRYPGFALNAFLARHYRSIGRIDGSVLYERHAESPLR